MPIVFKKDLGATVTYHLKCGYQRAQALAKDLSVQLKGDDGLHSAEDDTNGFFRDHESCVQVHYTTLQDAIRLDPKVRELLSRNVDFTYTARGHSSYGSRGATLSVTTHTTVTPK